MEEARKLLLDADKKLAETKVMEVQRMAQYAASLENNEEEEVPEAYLREDWNKQPQVSENNNFSLFSSFMMCNIFGLVKLMCLHQQNQQKLLKKWRVSIIQSFLEECFFNGIFIFGLPTVNEHKSFVLCQDLLQ